MFSQTFGIEIECVLPAGRNHADLASAIRAAGVECHAEFYNHTTRGHWKIVSDASVTGGFGAEIVSPVLIGPEGITALRKVCNVLTQFGCAVNQTCGFHVHVGVRDQGVEFFQRLIKTYAHFELSIDTVMPRSRRASNNHYCQSIRQVAERAKAATTIAQVLSAFHGRYWKLNPHSFHVHGTVEFRHHSGTVEADKAVNWALLCLAIVHRARQPGETVAVAAMPQPIVYRGRRVTARAWPQRHRALQLMLRPEGATEDELRQVMSTSTLQPGLSCKLFGYALRKATVDGEVRHYAVVPANAPMVQSAAPAELPEDTLAGLMQYVNAPDNVAAFFRSRAAYFAGRA